MRKNMKDLDRDGWLSAQERKRYRKAVAAVDSASAKLAAAISAIEPKAAARKRANKPPARRKRASNKSILSALGL